MRALRLFAIILLLALPAFAGEDGVIGSLTVDPSDPETVYAGTPRGLFKTTDGGETWTLISPAAQADVLAIADDAIYARFLARGLVRSTDGGETWSEVPGLPLGISDVAADPRNPDRIWAATGSKIWLSSDGGATWQARRKPVNRRPQPLTDLEVDPAGPWVYVLTTNGFFRSADLGNTWQLGQGITHVSPYLWQVVADPLNPSVLYLSTTQDLFRSLDRGATWKRVGAKTIAGGFVRDLVASEGRVYISILRKGIYFSSDRGTTWTRGAQGPNDPVALAAAPGVIYVSSEGRGHSGGLYRSFDRGVTWERPANDGLP